MPVNALCCPGTYPYYTPRAFIRVWLQVKLLAVYGQQDAVRADAHLLASMFQNNQLVRRSGRAGNNMLRTTQDVADLCYRHLAHVMLLDVQRSFSPQLHHNSNLISVACTTQSLWPGFPLSRQRCTGWYGA